MSTVTRILGLLFVLVLGAGCPVLPGVDDLQSNINAEVIVTGARPNHELVLEVGDIVRRAKTDGEPKFTFSLTLPPGTHTGALTVLEISDEGDAKPERCVGFALVIPEEEAPGVLDAVALDVPALPDCEDDEEEPPPCTVGLPCDDGIDCTDGDICLEPGVCVGRFIDGEECGACDATFCADSCAECCVPAEDACDETCGTCLLSCGAGDCACADSTCAIASEPQEATHATCSDDAVCRVDVADSPSSSTDCLDDSSCFVEGENVEVAQVACVDSTCLVEIEASRNVTMSCEDGSACALTANDTAQASLTCNASTCAFECGGLTDCLLTCGSGSVCTMACEDEACQLACDDGAVACELTCDGEGVECAPGETCECDAAVEDP